MTAAYRTLALALLVLVCASVAAQTQSPQGKQATSKKQQAERAKARCRLNHGVNCDTAEGLKEWLLAERSREEAVVDGSRHLPPAQKKTTPVRR